MFLMVGLVVSAFGCLGFKRWKVPVFDINPDPVIKFKDIPIRRFKAYDRAFHKSREAAGLPPMDPPPPSFDGMDEWVRAYLAGEFKE